MRNDRKVPTDPQQILLLFFPACSPAEYCYSRLRCVYNSHESLSFLYHDVTTEGNSFRATVPQFSSTTMPLKTQTQNRPEPPCCSAPLKQLRESNGESNLSEQMLVTVMTSRLLKQALPTWRLSLEKLSRAVLSTAAGPEQGMERRNQGRLHRGDTRPELGEEKTDKGRAQEPPSAPDVLWGNEEKPWGGVLHRLRCWDVGLWGAQLMIFPQAAVRLARTTVRDSRHDRIRQEFRRIATAQFWWLWQTEP